MGIRFAPSPTGRFHVGNLRTAWISWRLARVFGKPWVCRFEDIDGPRVLPGAIEKQLEDMKALGLVPDQISIQSSFQERHRGLFIQAMRDRRVYPCFCSRKEVLEALQGAASAPHQEVPIYNGKCRDLTEYPPTTHPTVAWRFRGAHPSGGQDFIIGRTTGLEPDSFAPAYNWACAIDDYDGNHELLVRAWDLDHVIAQQRVIHDWLSVGKGARPAPAVFHCALVTGNSGERLEKRTRGVILSELLDSGYSYENIVGCFERSFESIPGSGILAPGAIGGEARRRIALSELGL